MNTEIHISRKKPEDTLDGDNKSDVKVFVVINTGVQARESGPVNRAYWRYPIVVMRLLCALAAVVSMLQVLFGN